ncbi:amidohydrolase family protein [Desulfoplanes sp.]
MPIDIHTHAFHPKIADKVLAQLEDHYNIPPTGTGTVEDLLPRLHKAGIGRAAVHSAATKPDQVIPANNWAMAMQENHPQLVSFGTIHPGYENWEKELDRLEQNGIKGLKIHPDFQGFSMTDKRLAPIYETIGTRFVIMLHVGDTTPPEENASSPQKVAELIRNFPLLTVIAAHFGGYHHWEYVCDHLAGKNVFLDTSSSLFTIPQDLLEAIFNGHPRERILFGSDYPLFDPSEEIGLLAKRLRLTGPEIQDLLTNGDALLAK